MTRQDNDNTGGIRVLDLDDQLLDCERRTPDASIEANDDSPAMAYAAQPARSWALHIAVIIIAFLSAKTGSGGEWISDC